MLRINSAYQFIYLLVSIYSYIKICSAMMNIIHMYLIPSPSLHYTLGLLKVSNQKWTRKVDLWKWNHIKGNQQNRIIKVSAQKLKVAVTKESNNNGNH